MRQPLASGLKSLRRDRGLSLDKAAALTGVSKAMLGQIERDESSPTLNTLWKIARGYELSFSQLMALLVPAEEHQASAAMAPAGSGLMVRSLVPYDAGMRAELLELTLQPGCLRDSEPHESGVVEHVILIAGAVSVRCRQHWHTLKPGEAFRFDADVDHGYRNDSDTAPAVIHNLIHYPGGRSATRRP